MGVNFTDTNIIGGYSTMVLPAQQRVTIVAHPHPHRHSLCTVPPPASGITMAILGYLHLRPPRSLPV